MVRESGGSAMVNPCTIVTCAGSTATKAPAPLRVPVVQGESQRAHLCRLVGALEIGGPELKTALPAGAQVEITLELDRGGRLSARALAKASGQVFSQVAQLVTPDAAPEALRGAAASLLERAGTLRKQAFSSGQASAVAQVAGVEGRLAEVEKLAAAAEGGDADAGQKARRTLVEVDGLLEEAEEGLRWPQVEARATDRLAWAWSWSSMYGTQSEQRVLEETSIALERARAQGRGRGGAADQAGRLDRRCGVLPQPVGVVEPVRVLGFARRLRERPAQGAEPGDAGPRGAGEGRRGLAQAADRAARAADAARRAGAAARLR
jgi:hypothetical protein